MIRHVNSKWRLYSKDGSKLLGEFHTREEAIHHELQVEYFKHMAKKAAKPVKKKPVKKMK